MKRTITIYLPDGDEKEYIEGITCLKIYDDYAAPFPFVKIKITEEGTKTFSGMPFTVVEIKEKVDTTNDIPF